MNPKDNKIMEELARLKADFLELKKSYEMLMSSNTIPIQVDQAFQGRGFAKSTQLSTLATLLALSGIVKVTAGALSGIAGVSGSFYVANSSGGSPTHLVTVTNGVIVSIV